MTLKGTIKLIRPIQQISATFSKREFVIETQENYPQSIQLELHADRVDIIDSFTEGQEVECHLNIRGRLWTSPQGEDKYFNTLVCWKIQLPSANEPQSNQRVASTAPVIPPVEEKPFEVITGEEDDNLPF
jgi:hypothetical protein